VGSELDPAALERTRANAVARLLAERDVAGHWRGELSSSALATATASLALRACARSGVARAADDERLADRALEWLAAHANADGGFGDTPASPTNLSTTALAWVALRADAAGGERHAAVLRRAEERLGALAGGLEPARLAAAIRDAYGADRTFSVPILAACALGGRFGAGRAAWAGIPAIPFELAALPHHVFRWLGLPMVSYALPALIALGQVIHHHRPSRNPAARLARALMRERTLGILRSIQPSSGGFLEALPLTSFVALSLIGCGRAEHPVTLDCARFLRAAAREDGSFPIDTDLATWLTSLALDALAGGGQLAQHLGRAELARVAGWLARQQLAREHPYTHAAPGGWAWTDRPGGVPDADDTAGALIALAHLEAAGVEHGADPALGVRWLLGLQNQDGGIPTFCRGWGKLPFDQSCADLTAHALRAFGAWDARLTPPLRARLARARARAVHHLAAAQRADGAWVPLWFGSQHEPALENPLYGTTRVLEAGAELGDEGAPALARGLAWLLAAQHEDGGFGAARGLPPTIEETALALEALASATGEGAPDPALLHAARRAAAWLARRTEQGERFEPAPIGLYFAKLWYSERLYPLLFTVAALERARALLEPMPRHGRP
jgi:squalene-hopene/tetraprenyl-beta-curcumene cyclase